VLQLLRPGGLVVVDNTLWKGEVLNPSPDNQTKSILALNAKIHADTERVGELCMLPSADGITLARKR
jgi:caffeoyl-CoA O-methyltransferase